MSLKQSDTFELSKDILDSFKNEVESDPISILSMNASSKTDPLELCINRKFLYEVNHVFAHKVAEIKPVTNQKSSGRCWIYAALNVARLAFVKALNIEEFEFSQAYLFFWDKIERSNFYLNTIVDCLRNGEQIDGRLISFLLQKPVNDGGQWDMFVNLVNRYGLMPKPNFPESFCTQSSSRMNQMLTAKLKEFTRDIKNQFEENNDDSLLRNLLKKQMSIIYRIVAICLGIPPTSFTWEYYDKSKNYQAIKNITPLEFYEKHVKTAFDLDTKACLVSDPRKANPSGYAYTVHCLGNMVGGRKTIYNNQCIELVMKAVVDSLKDGEGVWFGCDVFKRFHKKTGFHGLEIVDYRIVFGEDIGLGLDKADRLIYGESEMTHAMAFTGVTADDDLNALKFRVENSWGEEHGEKGYLVLTADWFKNFVFEVVVDKKYLSEEVINVFDQEPKVLPAWDPMGALASDDVLSH